MIGAEIFIEPGQSEKDVETWFKILKENNMPFTRIRLFENYLKDRTGNWDFSLFDRAFKYADKYGIKIYGNLFPETEFTDVGGFKFPYDSDHLKRIAEYIKQTVGHFKNFRSLYGWVPINEPGGGRINAPLAKKIFHDWQLKNPISNENHGSPNHYNHLSFENENFLLYYNTWYLEWLSKEIRKHDDIKPIHVNTHQLFSNASQYNFPAWRSFLTSLGGSAHASWHFGYFNRSKYAVALSATTELILSGAGNIPWLMTELQGGNNIYSGYEPICPTKDEIAQWLWISIGSGSKGAIFWCLNPRASGIEAGEWAMVDFKNQPTDRLSEAGKIAKVIAIDKDIFSQVRPVNSKISILYSRESMWVEKRLADQVVSNFESRVPGAVMKSALGYFEALSQLGLQPSFGEFDEFDFTKNDYKGQTIILSNQIALPEKKYDKLRGFVKKGDN